MLSEMQNISVMRLKMTEEEASSWHRCLLEEASGEAAPAADQSGSPVITHTDSLGDTHRLLSLSCSVAPETTGTANLTFSSGFRYVSASDRVRLMRLFARPRHLDESNEVMTPFRSDTRLRGLVSVQYYT